VRALFAQSVITVIAGAAWLIACAPAAQRPVGRAVAKPPPAPTVDAGAEAGTAGRAGQEVPSLDALASRGPTDMPMMREALRVPEAAAKPTELEAKTVDTCYRAAVAAGLPVRAWFEDDKRARRGEVAPSSRAGLVPPRGPACARKGETLRLVVEATEGATIARAVVWQAP
jgi:hypothetical protein